jgi:enoyl-CoA hydratase
MHTYIYVSVRYVIQEFRLVRRCMQHRDFYEGVRALLVDKDGRPDWVPDSVDHASPRLTLEYFKPLKNPEDELVLPEL